MIKPFFLCRAQKLRTRSISTLNHFESCLFHYIHTHITIQSLPLLSINFLFLLYLWVQRSYGTVSHRPNRTPSLTPAVTLPPSSYFPNFPTFTSSSLNVLFSQMFVVIGLRYLQQAISLLGRLIQAVGNTLIRTLGNPQRLHYHGTSFRGLEILVNRSIPTAFDAR